MDSGSWGIHDSRDLYRLEDWAEGYVEINRKGHVAVTPSGKGGPEVDLYELVRTLQGREVGSPILLDFLDIVDDRLRRLREAFQEAIDENEYQGGYIAVYPIKVDQRRSTVEAVLRHSPDGTGLEVSSKAELLAVMAITAAHPNCLIVCNGFKDPHYIEAVMLAAKLGRRILPVVGSLEELEAILESSGRHRTLPLIGVRIKLSHRGSGRWADSVGQRSKFGLTPNEVLQVVERLRAKGRIDLLKLVHCHPGSQIRSIDYLKGAVTELARVYAELAAMGVDLEYIDVGGGLGVDYSGLAADVSSSVNYTLSEYASNVVYRIGQVCDDLDIRHPTILSESGRAIAAYQSVLVFEVLRQSEPGQAMEDDDAATLTACQESEHQPMCDLAEAWELVSPERSLESFHDAVEAWDQGHERFSLGHLGLRELATLESLFWAVCRKILRQYDSVRRLPEELADLPTRLSSICLCNVSIFQSLPDVWARGQIFPILPIQRLGEQPSRPSVLVDLTSDSDGRIDRFVGPEGSRKTVDLHVLRDGDPYFVAAFLAGAYQNALGGPHNTIGDHDVVQIRVGPDGSWRFAGTSTGHSVGEVLADARWETAQLRQELALDCRAAVSAGTISVQESRDLLQFYDQAVRGSTYLSSTRSRRQRP